MKTKSQKRTEAKKKAETLTAQKRARRLAKASLQQSNFVKGKKTKSAIPQSKKRKK